VLLHGPGGGRDRAWRTRAFWRDLALITWAGLGVAGVVYVIVVGLLGGVL
jgi:hypothetical protein